MDFVNQHYDELVNAIIRPHRAEYDIDDLGEPVFVWDGRTFMRKDFELKNKRALTLQCSQFIPVKHHKRMPVVVYCHGNAGSRLDALEVCRILLPMSISVVCFDFAGSGMSEGEYVSLGYYEKDDLIAVVDHLRSSNATTRIGLWGRSMGAVTSLMFGVLDPSIACLILDSPFSSLKALANELVGQLEQKIPKTIVNVAFKMLKKSIDKKADFNIEKLEPIKSAPSCFIPALFAHGLDDDFINPSHSLTLAEKYCGDYNRITFDGDHNSRRPRFFFDSCAIFLGNNLLVDADFDDGFGESHASKHMQTPARIEIDDEEEQLRLALALSLMDIKNSDNEIPAENAKSEPKPDDKPVDSKSDSSSAIPRRRKSSSSRRKHDIDKKEKKSREKKKGDKKGKK